MNAHVEIARGIEVSGEHAKEALQPCRVVSGKHGPKYSSFLDAKFKGDPCSASSKVFKIADER